MFTLDLSLRYSPFPISIQKKEHDDVLRLYEQIKNAMSENADTVLIDLTCDKIKSKSITVLSCLLYTSPSPRDRPLSRMPSSA